jgi:hypothetical protein
VRLIKARHTDSYVEETTWGCDSIIWGWL